MVESEGHAFALTTKGFYSNCRTLLIKTIHPKLFILDSEVSEFIPRNQGVSIKNIDLFTYVNAKFVYFEHHLKREMIILYNQLFQQQCELEKKVLLNALTTASIPPDEFAYQFMAQPGYIAHVAGEVIQIAKCITVEVRRRDTKECYHELPISRGNESYFMLPRTHVMTKTGTHVNCNPLYTPMYRFNDSWIQLNPAVSPVAEPQRLSPTLNYTWTYTYAKGLASGGVYSEIDLQNLRNHMMFPIERSAILNTIARDATGRMMPIKILNSTPSLTKKQLKMSLIMHGEKFGISLIRLVLLASLFLELMSLSRS
ncbi:GSCOCG00011893001-RA-CDS [Cotesia congregata]|nr:GSCOCG00011893001-RA-CDS [Cotesia congregata]